MSVLVTMLTGWLWPTRVLFVWVPVVICFGAVAEQVEDVLRARREEDPIQYHATLLSACVISLLVVAFCAFVLWEVLSRWPNWR